ncbi:hypothetical protein HK102_004748 [Quaeritorhiza haematococci]|nr:hypothetical protein HK102_004748 [Quaeritorhiza haematococci]
MPIDTEDEQPPPLVPITGTEDKTKDMEGTEINSSGDISSHGDGEHGYKSNSSSTSDVFYSPTATSELQLASSTPLSSSDVFESPLHVPSPSSSNLTELRGTEVVSPVPITTVVASASTAEGQTERIEPGSVGLDGAPHVQLTRACTFSRGKDVAGVYVEGHRGEVLVVKNHGEVEVSHVGDVQVGLGQSLSHAGAHGPGGKATIRVEPKGFVRQAKISVDNEYLAVLSSAKALEIFKANMGSPDYALRVHEVVKDAKSSDAILGFEWTFPKEFIIVSNVGVDFHSYSESRKDFVARKKVNLAVNWYVYSAEHRILVLSAGSTSLYLFYLKSGSHCHQLPSLKITMTCATSSPTNPQAASATTRQSPRSSTVHTQPSLQPARLTRRQITLATLYDKVYCCYIDVLRSPRPVMVLNRVSKSAVKPELELDLVEAGNYIVNVSDNLLVVHNLTTKTSALYDIKFRETPLVAPQAVLVYSEEPNDLYLDDWQAHLPDYILSPSRGTLYDVNINLDAICRDLRHGSYTRKKPSYLQIQKREPKQKQKETQPSSSETGRGIDDFALLKFLVRRCADDASVLLLNTLRGMMERRVCVRKMREVFDFLNAAAASGAAVVPQDEAAERTTGRSDKRGRSGLRRNYSAGSFASIASAASTGNMPVDSTVVESHPRTRAKSSTRTLGRSLFGTSNPTEVLPGARSGAAKASAVANTVTGFVVGQDDMYRDVFNVLHSEQSIPSRYLADCLLEYISSLMALNQRVAPYLYELLANILIVRSVSADVDKNNNPRFPSVTEVTSHQSSFSSMSSQDEAAIAARYNGSGGDLGASSSGGRRSPFRPPRKPSGSLSSYIRSSSSPTPFGHQHSTSSWAPLDLNTNCFAELQQYIQFRVIEDSIPLARLLLSKEDEFPPYGQLGVDMLKRLNANDEVVDALITRGKVLDALRFVINHRILRDYPATIFLESAHVSGDKTLFLNVYRCLEEHGMIPHDNMNSSLYGHRHGRGMDDVFLDDENGGPRRGGVVGGVVGGAGMGISDRRYVSVYREMWGAVVEMEGI